MLLNLFVSRTPLYVQYNFQSKIYSIISFIGKKLITIPIAVAVKVSATLLKTRRHYCFKLLPPPLGLRSSAALQQVVFTKRNIIQMFNNLFHHFPIVFHKAKAAAFTCFSVYSYFSGNYHRIFFFSKISVNSASSHHKGSRQQSIMIKGFCKIKIIVWF